MDINAQMWLSMPKIQRQQLLKDLIAGQNQTNYIGLVSAGPLGVYASLGVHFDYAIFGRDSLQVAEDLLGTHQELVHTIIMTLARLQGVKVDLKSEEEPGKIHHEYRTRIFLDEPIPEVSLNIMTKLQAVWGGSGTDSMCYYGSYDATPLYVRLVGAYVDEYGPDILSETYTTHGTQERIIDSLKAATNWIIKKLDSSSWGLLEYKRLNQKDGLANQVWKDSSTSYIHTSGEAANYDDGIASAELQGYAYDALLTATKLVADNQAQKKDWQDLAEQLSTQTLERLWLNDQKFFAQGLDRGEDGQTRRIETLTSNGALILDSDIFSQLAANQKQSIIEGVTAMIVSKEFMTTAGIRSRALSNKQMPGFVDYHGSYTVWPKETFAIARGMRRNGNSQLAGQLESQILDSVRHAGEFYEFFYVNDDGKIWYDRDQAAEYFKNSGLGEHLAMPELGQAWTISAVLSILSHIKR